MCLACDGPGPSAIAVLYSITHCRPASLAPRILLHAGLLAWDSHTLWGSVPCSTRVTWQASEDPSLGYSTLGPSGVPWDSGRHFQVVASFGHLAPRGLCIRQGMFLVEL